MTRAWDTLSRPLQRMFSASWTPQEASLSPVKHVVLLSMKQRVSVFVLSWVLNQHHRHHHHSRWQHPSSSSHHSLLRRLDPFTAPIPRFPLRNHYRFCIHAPRMVCSRLVIAERNIRNPRHSLMAKNVVYQWQNGVATTQSRKFLNRPTKLSPYSWRNISPSWEILVFASQRRDCAGIKIRLTITTYRSRLFVPRPVDMRSSFSPLYRQLGSRCDGRRWFGSTCHQGMEMDVDARRKEPVTGLMEGSHGTRSLRNVPLVSV